MKTLRSEYDFYDMSEDDRLAMVGTCFAVDNIPRIFFPIWLSEQGSSINYGVSQGLIFVSGIHKGKNGLWFRVGICTPDDGDLDLDFQDEDLHKREDVLRFMEQVNKINVTYEEVLEAVQAVFGGSLN